MNIVTKILRVLWITPYRSALLRTGVFASTEHDHVLEGLKIDTIVDIGANRGQFALCARRLYPRARIISLEPLRKPARTYLRVFRRDPLTTLINKAVSMESGTAMMNVSRWDVSSSLLPFAQAQHDNFPFTEQSAGERVSTASLSGCLGDNTLVGTSLLKLDVQGYELAALRASEDLLGTFQYVYVEVSFIELYLGQALASEIVSFLFVNNFKLICVTNLSCGRARRPIQADFLFARD